MRSVIMSMSMALLSVVGYMLLLTLFANGASVEPQVLAVTTTTTDSLENSMIVQINTIRRENGVKEITYSKSLKSLTNQRVTDMRVNEYYSHKAPDGTTYAGVIKDYVSESTFSCENLQLQVGADTNAVVTAWVNSPAHYKCLIDPRLTSIAISYDVHSEIDSDDSDMVEQMYVYAMIGSN